MIIKKISINIFTIEEIILSFKSLNIFFKLVINENYVISY